MEKNNLNEMSVSEIIDSVLDEVDREILELKYFKGYSVKQVAAEMRLTPRQAHDTIYEALKKLRPIIPLVSDEEPEDSDDILLEEEEIIAQAFKDEMSERSGKPIQFDEEESYDDDED